jgi:hypothetical protein
MRKLHIRTFLLSIKYVVIGAKHNGIIWGVKAFKGSLRLL